MSAISIMNMVSPVTNNKLGVFVEYSLAIGSRGCQHLKAESTTGIPSIIYTGEIVTPVFPVLGTEGVTMCHLLAPWKYKHMHSVCMPQHLCKVVFYPPNLEVHTIHGTNLALLLNVVISHYPHPLWKYIPPREKDKSKCFDKSIWLSFF